VVRQQGHRSELVAQHLGDADRDARASARARHSPTSHAPCQPHSDLAREKLKDPYKLDFLGLEDVARERQIEQALVDHVADFLIELGAVFP
jgi:predicted nuclease of restriction endonuclease-like (RecB) superfamily